MTKIERSIVIDRPIDDVFEFTHDLANNPVWQTTLVEVELLTDGPMRVGTRWQEVRRFLGKRIESVLELTEYEPNKRSAVKMVSGPVPFSGIYAYEPVDGGTRFTVGGELDAHGFFKLAEPVFARITGRELESNLGHLKDLLEAGDPSER
jgi:uncharacterized membrane protein